MGTFGLWKYTASHNVAYAGDKNPEVPVDHLLLDMNSVLHLCYSRQSPTFHSTIQLTIQHVKRFIDKYRPKYSLVFAFDGPAPISKISEQRHRRAKSVMCNEKMELNDAEIIAGSAFMLKCEEALEQELGRIIESRSSLQNVQIIGSRVPGEGEAKISQELLRLYRFQVTTNTYTAADRIMLVGGDSDLILASIACTPYHNFYLLNPYTLVVTQIGELMSHWVNAVPNRQLHLDYLPSYRKDFVFLMLLAGGDHFTGVEDDAVALWRNYRKLRADGGFFRQSLLHPNGEIHWEFFRQIVSRNQAQRQLYHNHKKNKKKVSESCPPEPGLQLLRGARWSLHTLFGHGCSDYHFAVREGIPKMASLRSALTSGTSKSVSKVSVSDAPPLTPLQLFVAALPRQEFLPRAIDEELTSEQLTKFRSMTSSTMIAKFVRELFDKADLSKLTPLQQRLNSFGAIQWLRGEPMTGSVDSTVPDSTSPEVSHSFETFVYPEEISEIRLMNFNDSRYVRVVRMRREETPTAVTEEEEKNAGAADDVCGEEKLETRQTPDGVSRSDDSD